VTFPVAVTLAAILTDLDWRRHVALEWDIQPFYQHIAKSIGEQSYPRYFLRNDPIHLWIRTHRARFEKLRKQHPGPTDSARSDNGDRVARPQPWVVGHSQSLCLKVR
jgi:hypothetical protein